MAQSTCYPRWLLEFADFLVETQDKTHRLHVWTKVARLALGFGLKLSPSAGAIAMHPAASPTFAAGVRMLEDDVDGTTLLLLAERWLERNGVDSASAQIPVLKPLRLLAHFTRQRRAVDPPAPTLMAGVGTFEASGRVLVQGAAPGAAAEPRPPGCMLVANADRTGWSLAAVAGSEVDEACTARDVALAARLAASAASTSAAASAASAASASAASTPRLLLSSTLASSRQPHIFSFAVQLQPEPGARAAADGAAAYDAVAGAAKDAPETAPPSTVLTEALWSRLKHLQVVTAPPSDQRPLASTWRPRGSLASDSDLPLPSDPF